MNPSTNCIEITGLPTEMLRALDQRAQQIGTSREGYVRQLIREDLSAPLRLRDLYRPVREQIAESGISEDELDALLDEAREEARMERQAKAATILPPLIREEINGVEMQYHPLGEYVVIQPGVQSGLPTIKHTRITAGAIVGRLRRGKPAELIARDFNIPLSAVLEADRLAAEYDYERSYV